MPSGKWRPICLGLTVLRTDNLPAANPACSTIENIFKGCTARYITNKVHALISCLIISFVINSWTTPWLGRYMHRCFNFHVRAQESAYKTHKKQRYCRSQCGDRTHDVQTQATSPAASPPTCLSHTPQHFGNFFKHSALIKGLCVKKMKIFCTSSRRHDIERFSASLPLCEGNPSVTIGSPHNGRVMRSFVIFFGLVEQIVNLPVIWDAMAFMWCHSKAQSQISMYLFVTGNNYKQLVT